MSKAYTTKSSIPAIARPAPTRPGRRRDDRTSTAGRLVRVGHDQDEGLARCHNISDGGMAISAGMPLDLNDRVIIAISLVELSGRVVWMNGRNYGIAFDQPIDSARILRDSPAGRTADAERSPRPVTSLRAAVSYRAGKCPVVVNAISVRGKKVMNDGNFQPGLRVRVILENGFEEDGIIHWSQDNVAGVMLLEPVKSVIDI